jgi:hypothetical protein
MVGRIGINALLIMIWVAAMWAIGPDQITTTEMDLNRSPEEVMRELQPK